MIRILMNTNQTVYRVHFTALLLCGLVFSSSANASELRLIDGFSGAINETAGLDLLGGTGSSDWDDDEGEYLPSEVRSGDWYGNELLWWTGGSILVGLIGAGFTNSNEAIASGFSAMAALGLTFSGMYVHAKYGYWGKAWGSLGLRAGLPFAGAMGGTLLGVVLTNGGLESILYGLLGAVLGVFTGHVIDVSVLAYHPGGTKLSLMPYVDVSEEARSAGLVLVF